MAFTWNISNIFKCTFLANKEIYHAVQMKNKISKSIDYRLYNEKIKNSDVKVMSEQSYILVSEVRVMSEQ